VVKSKKHEFFILFFVYRMYLSYLGIKYRDVVDSSTPRFAKLDFDNIISVWLPYFYIFKVWFEDCNFTRTRESETKRSPSFILFYKHKNSKWKILYIKFL